MSMDFVSQDQGKGGLFKNDEKEHGFAKQAGWGAGISNRGNSMNQGVEIGKFLGGSSVSLLFPKASLRT